MNGIRADSCRFMDLQTCRLPSREVGDAFVSFATNGTVCLDGAYTVLGVGVRAAHPSRAVRSFREQLPSA